MAASSASISVVNASSVFSAPADMIEYLGKAAYRSRPAKEASRERPANPASRGEIRPSAESRPRARRARESRRRRGRGRAGVRPRSRWGRPPRLLGIAAALGSAPDGGTRDFDRKACHAA